MPNATTQPCPTCGAAMRYETREDLLSYQGHERTIETVAWWCTHCDEAILVGEALNAQEKAFQELKAEVDALPG